MIIFLGLTIDDLYCGKVELYLISNLPKPPHRILEPVLRSKGQLFLFCLAFCDLYHKKGGN
ncbi:hypothetical protein PL10110_810006 [Planktothrix agardhii]|nr:hypothetical protein PL10110_810006 [Planktothrix agardhii]